MRIAIVTNSIWNAVNFRIGLIRKLVKDGHDVVVVGIDDFDAGRISDAGATPVPIKGSARGVGIFENAVLAWRFGIALRRHRVDGALTFTAKANILGGVSCVVLRKPFAPNIAGLGEPFRKSGWLRCILVNAYRVILRRCCLVIFQNEDDSRLLRKLGCVRQNTLTVRVPGSGIDLQRYVFSPRVDFVGKSSRYLFMARLLHSKGVLEFCEAARAARRIHPGLRFFLCGIADEHANDGVKLEALTPYMEDASIIFLGRTDSPMEVIKDCDFVVLPSYYREGVPRVLIEGLAVGRPLITTDWIGCRECVDDGANGFLVNIRDVESLFGAIVKASSLDAARYQEMCILSRRIAEERFDEEFVLSAYGGVIECFGS